MARGEMKAHDIIGDAMPNDGHPRRPPRRVIPTWRKLRFAAHWVATGSVKLAVIRSGYAVKDAQRRGSRLFADPYVRRCVRELMERRIERTMVDANFVLTELVRLYRACNIAEVLAVGEGPRGDFSLLPKFDLEGCPPEVLHAISEIKITEHGTVTIRMPDKVQLLELIGKHVDVSAWEDRVQLELRNQEDVVARLHEGRRRVAEARRVRLAANGGETVEDDAG